MAGEDEVVYVGLGDAQDARRPSRAGKSAELDDEQLARPPRVVLGQHTTDRIGLSASRRRPSADVST